MITANRQKRAHSAGAQVFLAIDEEERHWQVRLVDGLSASQARARISVRG